MEFFNDYKHMLDIHGLHERLMVRYIEDEATKNGYTYFNESKTYKYGDKIMFSFRDKLIILVKVGNDFNEGANMIVSHLDSPRLDVITGNPVIEKEDGVFFKVVDYGGIIPQSWLDRPLTLIGKVVNSENEVIEINTKKGFEGYDFTITSLLPHLSGRKEMKELKYEKLMVRIGNNKKENIMELIKEKYNVTDEDLKFADLSFVPSDNLREIGFDKDFIAGYGHDDKSCAYAELRAFFDAKLNNLTQVAIFASYEETGSRQATGCQTHIIDDFFLELIGDIKTTKRFIRNSFMISADVCAAYDSNYGSHFEDCAKAICGQGVGIVPYLGRKSGNDSSFEFRNYIRQLAEANEIKYSIETTKVSEGGGGTVSSFFGIKGTEVIDVGVPVLAMHSPQEVISKSDLYETYKLYKAFYEDK